MKNKRIRLRRDTRKTEWEKAYEEGAKKALASELASRKNLHNNYQMTINRLNENIASLEKEIATLKNRINNTKQDTIPIHDKETIIIKWMSIDGRSIIRIVKDDEPHKKDLGRLYFRLVRYVDSLLDEKEEALSGLSYMEEIEGNKGEINNGNT